MRIASFYGIEMEKEMKTSFQDYFNESIVTYIKEGTEHTLSVVYLRYFEENITQFTNFQENPICIFKDREIFLCDIVGLVYLVKNYKKSNRKRIFISDGQEFSTIFNDFHLDELICVLEKVDKRESFE